MGTGALALPLRGTVRHEEKRDQGKRGIASTWQMYYTVSKLKKIQKENLDMAKETQREKIERLERELEQVTKQRDEVFREVSALRRQINAAVEDTDAYKSIVAALQEEELKVKVARHSSELTEKMNRQLRNANAELQEKYDAAVTSYNAIRSDFEILSIESKAKGEETLKNTRGAGRKAALSKEAQEEVRDMHKLGMSYREIAKKIGVSFSVVARACQSKDDDKN